MSKKLSLYKTESDQYIITNSSVANATLICSDINEIIQTDETVLYRSLSESGREKISKTASKAQQGKNNNMYGTRWIHNPAKKKSKRIRATDDLPTGWKEGRKIKWD